MTLYDWLYSIFQRHPQLLVPVIISILALIISAFSLFLNYRDWKGRKKIEEDKKLAQEDKEWVEQLRLSLQHAYDSIALRNNEGDIPVSDRVSWLTAARHISRYWCMKKNLKTDIYKTLCNEHEEYWRHRFYLLLNKIETDRFFGIKFIIGEGHGEIVDLRSAAIVFAFAQWKDDDQDPTDDYSLENLIVDYDLFSYKCRVLREFIKRERPLVADKVKEMQSKRCS